jgi:hypothetical protein
VGVEAPARLYGGVRNTVKSMAMSAARRARRLAARTSAQRVLPRRKAA